jgi:hypothetical protein
MITDNKSLAIEAAGLIANVDQLMIHEVSGEANSSTCYDIAAKLERARNMLLVLGDRAYKREQRSHTIDIIEGVPF